MTTLESYEKSHKNNGNAAKDLAIFAAMCATCGPVFTIWFYGSGILLLILLWLAM